MGKDVVGQLRARRLASGLAIEELARQLSVDAAFLSDIERGARPLSNALRLRWLEALQMTGAEAANEDGRGEKDVAPSPFKGLYSYLTSDREYFYGREEFVRGILTTLSHSNICLIAGPSGVGKTSLINAGVIASLEKDIAVLAFRPGLDPLLSLAAAVFRLEAFETLNEIRDRLSRPNFLRNLKRKLKARRILVVIDQFEELFRITGPDERASFGEHMLELVTSLEGSGELEVIASMRSDFLGRLAEDDKLSKVFSSAIRLVPPLTPQSIERIIREPLRQHGVVIDDEIVTDLIKGIQDNQTALPLLNFCLDRLWSKRAGNTIEAAAYRGIGGIGGVITEIAEAEFALLSEEEKQICRDLLVDMVAFAPTGSSEPHTKKKLRTSALAKGVHRVVDRFIAARLLAGGTDHDNETVVEFAHEAIMQAWPRLAGWIKDDEDNVRYLDGIRAAATLWMEDNRNPSLLWQGRRLAESNAKLEGGLLRRINAAEQEFIAASNQLQKIDDRTRVDGLLKILDSLPPSLWGAVSRQLRDLGAPSLRNAFDSPGSPTSFRQKVVLVSAGLLAEEEVANCWKDVDLVEMLVAARELGASGKSAALERELRKEPNGSAPTLLILAALVGEDDESWPPASGAPADEDFFELAQLLSQLDETLAQSIALRVARTFPRAVRGFAHWLRQQDDPQAFSRCYLLLRFLAHVDPELLGIALCEVPVRFFRDILLQGEPGEDGGRKVRAALLQSTPTASDGFGHERACNRAAAMAILGDPADLLNRLNSPGTFDQASTLVSRARELCLERCAMDLLRGLDDKSATPLMAGNMLQLVGCSGVGYDWDQIAPMVLSIANRFPTAFVISSAEWAIRSNPSCRNPTEMLESLPQRGPDFFRVRLAGDASYWKFVRCQPSRFRMGVGSAQKTKFYLDSSRDVDVTISKPFWIADRLVTRSVFGLAEKSLALDGVPSISHVAPTMDCPVVAVTWHEAEAVADWIVGQVETPDGADKPLPSGRALPSEAEWEYACRADASWDYSFGSDAGMLEDFGWYALNSENQARPSGLKRPNQFGLFDMHGNCWEWCADWFGEYPDSPQTDPMGPADGTTRSLRGGCWNLSSDYCRSFTRNAHSPGNRNYYLGFRPSFRTQ